MRYGRDRAYQPVTALLTANTVSQIGDTLGFIALPWFVLATTGSTSQTGIAVATGIIPVVLVGIFGGALVDRYDWTRMSIVSDLASGLTTLAIPTLYLLDMLVFPLLLALVLLGTLLDQPGRSARFAMFPDLVQRTPMTLDRANALYGTTSRIAQVAGPPLAGLLIALLGPVHVLWLNAASFAISALVVLRWVPSIPRERSPTPSGNPVGRYMHELGEGFRALHARSALLNLILVFCAGSLIAEPLYAIILPVYASEHFGNAAGLGVIFAGLGAGSMVGSALYAVLAHRVSRRSLVLGGFAIRAACFGVMLMEPDWWAIAIAIFLCAVAFQPINPMFMTVMQEQVPPGLRGRVSGIGGALGSVALPAGVMLYTALMSALDLAATLNIFVLVNLALASVLFFLPALRQLAPPPATIATRS